jgi:deazaflavin-dependent oxidoreductase (nitroreductase family)
MSSRKPRLAFIRPFTTHVFNRFARRFAGRLPGFGLLTYVGRKTGATYRTPMNVFWRDGRAVFALTYGSDVQWLKNVLAAGGCTIRTLGRDVRLVEPEVAHDPELREFPLPVRLIAGRLAGTTEILRMRRG